MADNSEVILNIENKTAFLRLAPAETKIAVLTEGRMNSLKRTIQELKQKEGEIELLLITGSSPAGFCAGADIGIIENVTDPKIGEDLAKKGQEIFADLEKLKFPKLALIRGACVGGGCELVLACDYRVLVETEETKIGLPEVRLGILPGFGGTQRLPRLIGLPSALDIILNGKVVPAKQAFKMGLASYLIQENPRLELNERFKEVEKECLESFKKGIIQKKKRKRSLVERFLTNNFIGRAIVENRAKATLNKETKGHYPAPYKALSSVMYGLSNGEQKGYIYEAKELGELVATSVCKSLVHLFKISEGATKLAKSFPSDKKITKIGVIGAGVMGAGIAGSFIAKGFSVVLLDAFAEALEKGRKQIVTAIEKRRSIAKEKKKEIISKLHCDTASVALRNSELIVEAVIEDFELKKNLLLGVKKTIPESCLIASNTSSLSISNLGAALNSPEKTAGMHFFNPVEKMPLVEIIRGKQSSEESINKLLSLVAAIGKYPVLVEDVPGFLVNRILTPYLTQAAVLLSEGFSVEQIDSACLKFGMPMGAIRLLDEVGLDVAAKVAEGMAKAYGPRMQGPDFAAKLLAQGRKGKKSGSGFYLYSKKSKETVDPSLNSLLNLPRNPKYNLSSEELTQRLILPLVNEAAYCLEEKVAGSGKEAACQIDLASVMGFGFAPFRGGLIFYAEKKGAKEIYRLLQEYSERFSTAYFTPCSGIQRRAEQGISFYQDIF